MPTEIELTLEQTQQGVSYEVSIPILQSGNPVKKILLKLNPPDHRQERILVANSWPLVSNLLQSSPMLQSFLIGALMYCLKAGTNSRWSIVYPVRPMAVLRFNLERFVTDIEL
ncbi:hypothetical protein Tco_0729995 [Tanacetum coccineum]|uniref:Uncharacterized protein n=1 Tax=Tanacetum coccineum TaxID=301880 RepID=A0ABQ4YQG4_9ASTR